MARTYSEREAVEAVAAAILFAELDVARNAAEGRGGTIRGRCDSTFDVDEGTRELLAKAYRIVDAHGMALGMYEGQPLTRHDLRRAFAEDEEAGL